MSSQSFSMHSRLLAPMGAEEFDKFMILPTKDEIPIVNNNEDPKSSSSQPIDWNDSESQDLTQLGKSVKTSERIRNSIRHTYKTIGTNAQNILPRKRRTKAEVKNCSKEQNDDIRKEQNARSARKVVSTDKKILVTAAKSVRGHMEQLGDWTEEEQEMEMRRTRIQDENDPNDDFENQIHNKCMAFNNPREQLKLRTEMRTSDFRYFSLLLPDNPSIPENKNTAAAQKSRASGDAIRADLLYENKRLELENQRKKVYEEEMGVEQLVIRSHLPILLDDVQITKNDIKKLAECALELNEQLNGGKQEGWTLWDGATDITHAKLELTQGYDGNVQFTNEEVLCAKTMFDERISTNPYMNNTVPVFLKSLEKTQYERNKAWYQELSEISLEEGTSQRNQTAGTQGSPQFLKSLQAKLILYIAQLEIALHMQSEAGSACEQTVQERQREQERRRERVKKPLVKTGYSGNFAVDFEELVSSSSSGVSREPHFVIMTGKEFSAPSRSTARSSSADDTVKNQQEEMDPEDRYMPQCDVSQESFTDHQFTHDQPSSSECEDSESQYTITELQSTSPSVSEESMRQNPNAIVFPDEENEKMEWDDDSGYQILAAAPDPNYNPNWPIHEDEIDRQLAKDIESGEAELTIERELNKMRRRGLEKYFEDNIVVKFGSESDFGSVGNFKDRMWNERDCAENKALLNLEPNNDYLKWLKETFTNELKTANPHQLNPYFFDKFIFWLEQKLEQVKAYRSGQVSRLESAVRLANIELECRREKKVQVAFKNLEEELQKFVNHQLSMG